VVGIGIGIGIGVGRSLRGGKFVPFSHERLDVYRAAIEYVGWSYRLCSELKADQRAAKEQLLRAAQSIPAEYCRG
jgi:hypothetical protein